MDSKRGAVFRQLHESGSFIPDLSDMDSIQVAAQAVVAPLSVGIRSGGRTLSLEALVEVGVRRVSTEGALPRAIYAFVLSASRGMLAGSFESLSSAIPETEINEMSRRA